MSDDPVVPGGADRQPDAAEPAASDTGDDLGTSTSEAVMTPPPGFAFRTIPGCLAAWAVPGLGHVVLGRHRRGLLFAALILGLFVAGLALDGKVYRPVEGEPLTYLAALGAAGAGGPFLVAHGAGWADGDLTSPFHDYGNTFTLVAGLLNLLVVLDAFDVAAGRR